MVDCRNVLEALSSYIDGELSVDEEQAIGQHLQKCNSCQQEHMDLKITVAIMHSLGPVEPPPDFRSQLETKLSNIKMNNPSPFSRWFNTSWIAYGGVAAALLIVTISLGAYFNSGPGKHFSTAMDAPNEVMEEALPSQGEGEMRGFASDSRKERETETAEHSVTGPSDDPYLDQDIETDAAGNDGTEEKTNNLKEKHIKKPDGHGQNEGIAVAMLPPEEEEIVQEEGAFFRTMSAPVPPLVEEGPKVLLEIEMTEPEAGLKDIEGIVREYDLEMETIYDEELIDIEIIAPTIRETKITKKISQIGNTINKEELDFSLEENLAALTEDKNQFIQRKNELRALIETGGSPEEEELWQGELDSLEIIIEQREEEIARLEKAGATTIISVKLLQSIED